MEEVKYFIYILFSQKSGNYYVGHSNDPLRRVNEHNTKPFNTYTSKNRSWALAAVFFCPGEKSAAMKIEKFIKKQKSQHFIEKIINPDFTLEGVLAQLVILYVRDRTCGINQSPDSYRVVQVQSEEPFIKLNLVFLLSGQTISGSKKI